MKTTNNRKQGLLTWSFALVSTLALSVGCASTTESVDPSDSESAAPSIGDDSNGLGSAEQAIVAPAAVIAPRVECVELLANGAIRAHWGYTSAFPTSMSLPDNLNAFAPLPSGRGQPTTFLPGTQRDVFTTDYTPTPRDPDLTWTVVGNSATADVNSPRCAPKCITNADCNDRRFCNGVEACVAGVCRPGTPPACDDGLFCNGVETCDEAADRCQAGLAPVCSDGNACNGLETCNETSNSCSPGTAPNCDDSNPCTADSCSAAGGCAHAVLADGTSCGSSAVCRAGGCVPVGCTNNQQCNDGLYCNGSETCNLATGQCRPGVAPVCSDGNACNGLETCNEATDSCVGGDRPNCDDNNVCTVDSCVPATGCQHTPRPNGTECGPYAICQDGDCDGCQTDSDCADDQYCNGVEKCDVRTGRCLPGAPVVCADGNLCNGTETCNEATDTCVPGIRLDCSDSDECTTDSCVPATGCQHTRLPPGSCGCRYDADCNDGLYCNGVETCNQRTGQCLAGIAVVCSDGNVCNGVETCNEATDSCADGKDLDCNDGNACTNDRCDTVVGCLNPVLPNGTMCGPSPYNRCLNGICGSL